MLRIDGNLNSNGYVHEVLQLEVFSFFKAIPGAIFQQVYARPHVEKTVRNFCLTHHMQLLSWPAYLPDVSSIEHVGYLDDRRLFRDPRPAASKDKIWLRIQAI